MTGGGAETRDASVGTRRALRRARSALVGRRSRTLAFLARLGAVRVSPRFSGLRWLSVVALLLLAAQMLTGVLLSLYYYPEPGAALASVRFITTEVTVGWLVRGVHHWAGELLVVCVVAHVAVVYARRAYVRPRDHQWMAGIALLCVVLVFRFTGRLLPWDTLGHAVTAQGLELIESVPLAGRLVAAWLRGGEDLGANTLSRFFTTHVIILPWLAIALLAAHAWMLGQHGLKGEDA
ncbi:MAG TPA: cytochrome b N-terminal domain-containing protein [Planctomycetota bacterium]|nr:cytochrome b N-terminal domain-containing protein [Planctomycetota bacterium]